MTSKKIILISFVFILAVLFAGFEYYAFLKQNGNKTQIARECVNTDNSYAKPVEKNSDVGMTKKWSAYYDERYKYQIDFPAGLNATNIFEHTRKVKLSKDSVDNFLTLTTNGGVTFASADIPLSVISIEIFDNSEFKTTDEWLKNENIRELNRIIEKKINIDGNEAIITHQISMLNGKIFEEFKNPKTTVFIKDNTLFVITTSMDDNDSEKVWNSFKFITGKYPVY
ncbi:MAG: hypothetical protein V1667_00195 [bacterium]